MVWWQTALVLALIGLLAVVCGMIIGIPLSKRILRRRQSQTLAGSYRVSPKPETSYTRTTADQFDELLKKYMASKPGIEEKAREVVPKSNGVGAEAGAELAGPAVNGPLLAELEKNYEISVESSSDRREPFQTSIWDGDPDARKTLSVDSQWELTQAYMDMYVANNVIWFLNEFERKSPALDVQYVRMCSQISARLGKIIPALKPTRQIPT